MDLACDTLPDSFLPGSSWVNKCKECVPAVLIPGLTAGLQHGGRRPQLTGSRRSCLTRMSARLRAATSAGMPPSTKAVPSHLAGRWDPGGVQSWHFRSTSSAFVICRITPHILCVHHLHSRPVDSCLTCVVARGIGKGAGN